MASPEWAILNRLFLLVSEMAAGNQFVPSAGEAVRPVLPHAVRVWKANEGGATTRTASGFTNILLPGILLSPVGVQAVPQSGVNCADDESHLFLVQVVDTAPDPAGHSTPIRTYLDWIELIRGQLLAHPNPFLQDATPSEYDPFIVHVRRRTPVDPTFLLRHRQQVAALSFQVTVRHHR
jgi:hypothetical protein